MHIINIHIYMYLNLSTGLNFYGCVEPAVKHGTHAALLRAFMLDQLRCENLAFSSATLITKFLLANKQI